VDTLPVRLRDADKENFPPIFIDAGDHDVEYESIIAFEKLLNQMNIPHEWHEYQGFHEEKYWSAHVDEYLRWYTQGWK
jgi:S-formylglutathione hydrolase FrmB